MPLMPHNRIHNQFSYQNCFAILSRYGLTALNVNKQYENLAAFILHDVYTYKHQASHHLHSFVSYIHV